jgi:hypothetical protein
MKMQEGRYGDMRYTHRRLSDTRQSGLKKSMENLFCATVSVLGTSNALFFSKRNMSLHFVVIIRYGTAEVKIKSKSLLKRGCVQFYSETEGCK